MTTPKTRDRQSVRQLHRLLAPFMLLPLLLTAITGTFYQMLDLAGQGEEGDWLLNLHKGHFGSLNLEVIYPFLNALGLIVLAVTGLSMWLKLRSNRHRSA